METVGVLLGTFGLILMGVAVWGLIRGGVGWARLTSRGMSGAALAGGFVLVMIGGSLIPVEEAVDDNAGDTTTTAIEDNLPFAATTTTARRTTTTAAPTTTAATTPPPPPPTTAAPPPPPPTTAAPPPPAPAACDPNYSGACVPPYPPDVDCGDIGQPVRVVGSDPHGLDRDGDGAGCESS